MGPGGGVRTETGQKEAANQKSEGPSVAVVFLCIQLLPAILVFRPLAPFQALSEPLQQLPVPALNIYIFSLQYVHCREARFALPTQMAPQPNHLQKPNCSSSPSTKMLDRLESSYLSTCLFQDSSPSFSTDLGVLYSCLYCM